MDLVEYTTRRASLEAAENDESFAKKATDKALEKLTEGATKLGERLASDASALGKRAGLAVTIPLELHALLSEWDRKMLPKTCQVQWYQTGPCLCIQKGWHHART